jgi:hypothetical protein
MLPNFFNDLELAFDFIKVLDVGVRQVQAALPGAAGNTKLNVVLGTVEGALGVAQEAQVSYTAVAPALTGAINAIVAGYETAGDPAFTASATSTQTDSAAPATDLSSEPAAAPAAPAGAAGA